MLRDRLLPSQPAPPARDASVAWAIALSCAASYSLTYFWRYPAFVLPQEVLSQRVVGSLDLQACMSLAMILGFGAAKLPAATVAASQLFFQRRLRVLSTLFTCSMLIEGVGLLSASSLVKVSSIFVSSFLSSFLYGLQLTYLEGRRATEGMLAVSTLFLVYAGNASRGVGRWVLDMGCPARAMPLVVGAAAWLPAIALVVLTDRLPRPSDADICARSVRGTMTRAQRHGFVREWAGGLALLIVAYALLVGLRALRDLYSAELFAEALRAHTTPTWVYYVVDAPGAALSALCLLGAMFITDSRRALIAMLATMLCGLGLALGTTVLFAYGRLDGLVWQTCFGTGLYVAFSLLGAPFIERLLAATKTTGTISFLVFLSDFAGYAVSISLLLWQDLAPSKPRCAPSRPHFDGCARMAAPSSSATTTTTGGAAGSAEGAGNAAALYIASRAVGGEDQAVLDFFVRAAMVCS